MDTEGEHVDSNSMYGTLAALNIDKKIGKGQFSEVYRVVCKATGNVLALKKVQVHVCLKTFYYKHVAALINSYIFCLHKVIIIVSKTEMKNKE